LAVSPEFFSITDVHPILGRRFTSDEGRAGAQPVLLHFAIPVGLALVLAAIGICG
jgi:hypothetical protein